MTLVSETSIMNQRFWSYAGFDDDASDDDNDQFRLLDSPEFEQAPRRGPKSSDLKVQKGHACGFTILALILLLLIFHRHLYVLLLRMRNIPPGLWSSDGKLVVGPSIDFHIKGVSWYGMELTTHCFEGLNTRGMDDILDTISGLNFNAIRVPLALDHFEADPRPGPEQLSIFANPDLKGMSYKNLLEALIVKAASRHMLVLLDLHRLRSSEWPTDGFWYNNRTSEADVVTFWTTIANLFRSHWNIIGADLYNEPHGTKNWSNWRAFVEKAGNEIHVHAPKWMIFAEGVGNEVVGVQKPVFWAENLHPAYSDPPELSEPRKLVLSPHVYGPSVYNQSYFASPSFPGNMPEIWDDHFGLASSRTRHALVVGEFGGTNRDRDQRWQSAFVQYLTIRKISCFYWCLNPGSSDTGGILHHDWHAIDISKADLLANLRSSNVKKHMLHLTRR